MSESASFRSAMGVRSRPGGEPGAGQEHYAGHKRDARPDRVMSLMDAPNHEMQRVRCAGQVENPRDDRQDPDDRQDDGQRPPTGRTARPACRVHFDSPAPPADIVGRLRRPTVTSRRRPARLGRRAIVDPAQARPAEPQPPTGYAAATGNDDHWRAKRRQLHSPSSRRGSPACGNSTAPAARSRSSRRRRKVAAATPSASVSGPTATRVASVVGRSSMATPDTCAAQIREPASTIIIEGAGRRE